PKTPSSATTQRSPATWSTNPASAVTSPLPGTPPPAPSNRSGDLTSPLVFAGAALQGGPFFLSPRFSFFYDPLFCSDLSATLFASAAPLVISPCDSLATNALNKYVSFSNRCKPSIFGGLSFQIDMSSLSMSCTHFSNPVSSKSARRAITA